MEQEVDNLKFGSARQFYNDVIGVTAQYNVTMTDTILIKKMAKKVNDPVYVQLIIMHLVGNTQDLEELYKQIDTIQSLSKTKNGANAKEAGKETALAKADGYVFKDKCSNCNEVGHKRSDYKKPKKGVNKGQGGSGNDGGRGCGGANSNKHCNKCGKKGHEEKDCWGTRKTSRSCARRLMSFSLCRRRANTKEAKKNSAGRS